MRTRTVALLGILTVAILLTWWSQTPAPPIDTPSPTGPAPAAAAAATAAPATGTPAPVEDRTVVPLDPTAPVYRVHGRVLADRRQGLAGAEVVARRGRPTDSTSLLSLMGRPQAGGAPPSAFPFVVDGDVLARAAVDTDGTFELQTNEPQLRLVLEHDFYGLALPEVVRVPAATAAIEVVLAPYLGGCIRGRLLGDGSTGVRGVRLLAEPDAMSVLRDPQAFFASIARARRAAVVPSAVGEFTFRAVGVGAALTLLADGETATGRVRQPPLEPGELRDVALPVVAAATLAIDVVDEGGQAIAGVRLAAHLDEVADTMTREVGAVRGTTDANGHASLVGLQPGTWRVRGTATGWLSSTVTVVAPSAGPTTLTLTRGGTIAGVVVDPAGAPIAAARVAATPVMDVPILGDLTAQLGADALAQMAEDGVPTDADGRFQLTGVEPETRCTVIAAHAAYAAGMASDVRAGATDIRITLAPNTSLAAKVTAAEDGTPLAAFTLELRASMFLVMDRPVRSESFATADGTARLDALPAGDYTLAARAEGRSEVTVSVKLVAGGAPTTHELALPLAATVTGRVLDDQGRGIAAALVQRSHGGLRDNPMLTLMQNSGAAVRTDADGNWRLGGLEPGRLQLQATAQGFASGKSARIEVAAGQTLSGIDITLDHGGSIEGIVRTVAGELAEDFSVLAQSEATQKAASCTPAADGRFRIDNLEPGRYQVQAMHPAAMRVMRATDDIDPTRNFDWKQMISRITDNMVSQRCTVQSGAVTQVELDASDLGSGARLSLRVTVGGRPLERGVVEAVAIDDGRVRIGFLDRGETTFAALHPGKLRLQVRAGLTQTPVGAPQFVTVPLGTDHHRTTVELPGGELAGHVLDERGQPLPAVLVRLLRGSNPGDDDLLGTAITDTDGAFAFGGLPPDTYGLVAADAWRAHSAAGAASRAEDLRLGDGERRAGIELRAQPAAGVTVTVTDVAGAPLVGAMLMAVDTDGRPLGNHALAVTGHDGKAHLGGLPRGTLRVAGRAQGYAPDVTAPFEAAPAASHEVALMLPRGTRVSLDARGRDGLSLAGVEVRARCNGGPWFSGMLLLEARLADGRLDLGRLAPGNWEFHVAHPATGAFTVARTVADGAAVVVLATPPR